MCHPQCPGLGWAGPGVPPAVSCAGPGLLLTVSCAGLARAGCVTHGVLCWAGFVTHGVLCWAGQGWLCHPRCPVLWVATFVALKEGPGWEGQA